VSFGSRVFFLDRVNDGRRRRDVTVAQLSDRHHHPSFGRRNIVPRWRDDVE
jgi:hypothetical protein